MSQRDPRLNEQLGWLAQDVRQVRVLLALPANAQSGSLRQIVTRFAGIAPAAAVLTKTDEATSLGPALSTLIRAGLPLAWVANGQRVPEDLHLLRNRQTWLVKMAVELMRQDPALPGEQDIAQRYAENTRAFA
jgi:flagellar biosynthesis protein FlhF